jgi:hypothetical protein
MEPPVRIELTTFRLQGGCSTTELGRPVTLTATRRNYDRGWANLKIAAGGLGYVHATRRT